MLCVATSTTNQCCHIMTYVSSTVNGGHSPLEESPSQSSIYHVNLPCIHHKWPLFTPHELIITPEVYEKLGQQHYDLLYSNIWMLHLNLHCAHAALFIDASFNACCPIIIVLWSTGANVHSRLNVWACAKTMILVQSSPVQRLYTAFIARE